MITLKDFKRLTNSIKLRIFLALGRGIVTAINNAEGTQKVQITALSRETITDIERFQEYGFETYPFANAEAFGAFLNGNRDHGIILCIHDRRYRPKDLVEGEVCMYTDEDSNDFRFHLKRDRIAELKGDKSHETLDTLKYINCDEITLGSDTRAAVRKIVDERFQTLYNAHVHSGITPGNSNTGTPTTTLTTSHMTDKTRAL